MKKYDSLIKKAYVELEEWKDQSDNHRNIGTYGKVNTIINKASKCKTNNALRALLNYRVTEIENLGFFSKSLEKISNITFKEELDAMHERRRN